LSFGCKCRAENRLQNRHGDQGGKIPVEAGRNGGLVIILLVEKADAASLEDVHALGADDLLYKPIPVNILESRVKALMSGVTANARRLGGEKAAR
jgi:DNA-binding response OmpR family regulator